MNNEPLTTNTTPLPTASQTPPPAKSNKNSLFITVLVVGLLVGGGVYYWMNQQVSSVKNDNSSLKEQNEELKTVIASENVDEQYTVITDPGDGTSAQAASGTVAASVLGTGQVTYGDSGGGRKVVFDCFQEPGTLTNIWVRYGTSLDSLKETDKFTNELGLGEAGSFVPYPVFTSASNLKAGANHYYQCAATKDGKTIFSNFAVFAAEK